MKHSINKDPVVSFLEFYAHRKLEPQNILALSKLWVKWEFKSLGIFYNWSRDRKSSTSFTEKIIGGKQGKMKSR